MQNLSPTTPFRRGAVEPVECLKKGWSLIRDQYWLFVGMGLGAVLLGSLVPFGIILGPLMCGIYLSFFQLRKGQRVEFGTLFKGFDYFAESAIASLIHYVPIVVIILPFYIVFYAGLFLIMPRQGGGDPNPGALFGFFAVVMVLMIVMIVLVMLISLIFTFSYPLIVDRRLSAIEAVKLSAKAALGNFWPLLGLQILNGLIVFGGALLCYVGMFLAFPVTFAAIAAAYEQVFGLGEAQAPNLPPPPPSFT